MDVNGVIDHMLVLHLQCIARGLVSSFKKLTVLLTRSLAHNLLDRAQINYYNTTCENIARKLRRRLSEISFVMLLRCYAI
jgi:hypothetical protein